MVCSINNISHEREKLLYLDNKRKNMGLKTTSVLQCFYINMTLVERPVLNHPLLFNIHAKNRQFHVFICMA
jgi:hypothetical protein